jgi:hypothetical protein
MLPLIARSLRHGGSQGGRALQQAMQLQQKRFLNIHEYQGAQLMAKFGINVPDGAPAFTVADVAKEAEKYKDEKGEVCARRRNYPSRARCLPGALRSVHQWSCDTCLGRPSVQLPRPLTPPLCRRGPYSGPAAVPLRQQRGRACAPHPPTPPHAGRPEKPDPRRRPRPREVHKRPAGRRPHLHRGQGFRARKADAGRHPGHQADGAGRQAGRHAVRRAQDEAQAGDVLCHPAGPQDGRAHHDRLQVRRARRQRRSLQIDSATPMARGPQKTASTRVKGSRQGAGAAEDALQGRGQAAAVR